MRERAVPDEFGEHAGHSPVHHLWGGKGHMQQEVQEGRQIPVHAQEEQRGRRFEGLRDHAPQKDRQKPPKIVTDVAAIAGNNATAESSGGRKQPILELVNDLCRKFDD